MNKIFAFFAFFFAFFSLVANASQPQPTKVDLWLVAGPYTLAKPVFDTVPDIKGNVFNPSDWFQLVDFPLTFDRPDKGKESPIGGCFWEEKKCNNYSLTLPESTNGGHALWLASTCFNLEEFSKIQFSLSGDYSFEVWLDGVKQTSAIAKDGAKGEFKASLARGSHWLMLKILVGSGYNKKRTPGIKVEASNFIAFSVSPKQPVSLAHVLEGVSVADGSVSSDGLYAMVRLKTVTGDKGRSFYETRVYQLSTDSIVWKSRSGHQSNIMFSPVPHCISYYEDMPDGKVLVVENLVSKTKQNFFGLNKISGYSWSPNGDFLIGTQDVEGEKEEGIPRLVVNPNDRWPWYRSRTKLWIYRLSSKVSEPLTWGFLSANLEAVAADGSFILFSTAEPDFHQRPYSRHKLFKMNLSTRKTEQIWDLSGSCSLKLSPDNHTLLVTASSTFFGEIGNTLAPETIPNDYNTQAYLYDLNDKKIIPITRDFAPKVLDAQWAEMGKSIVLLAENKTYCDVFLCSRDDLHFQKIESATDVVAGMAVSENSNHILGWGTSVSYPTVIWKGDLDKKTSKLVLNPNSDQFKNVEFGKVKSFVFKSVSGDSIDGMVFYPPHFDSTKLYPVVVYYYGGTNPINRSFEGRYPKNLFAAMGYIVYTMNPDGCTGYGDNFAARHVNNWGLTTADQIIEGTRCFLRSHTFADSTRVGCIGASYGGFMTMLLQTKTDLFRTAISHAGISNLSSYWGEGYWGYLYGSAATANHFPWNDPGLFTRQSPLYNADKVKTPILLLHGNKDTNVPTSESRQFFTALTLLGKEVTLVEFDGQDHQILEYNARIKWQNTIFAWFDKWLKDQPEWWSELYPERKM